MIRKILAIGASVVISGLLGCNNPVAPDPDISPAISTGVNMVFRSGGSPTESSKWDKNYMIVENDYYPQMRFTTEEAHSGKYSITTDSNRTALVYSVPNRIEKGIVGVEFYIMTKAPDSINFTVALGQNAGSSGGLFKSFGIGFDPQDSIKTNMYDNNSSGWTEKMISSILPNHWYKCKIEVDMTQKTVTYWIDDQQVNEGPLPTQEMFGIDRLLVFRGLSSGQDGINSCKEGPKQYYADDIVMYTR